MNDVKKEITLNGEVFPLVFNLNVMEEIQDKYNSITEWGRITEANADGLDVKAVKFGLCAMINEAIEIENEETKGTRPPITEKWLGRHLTEEALGGVAGTMNDLVIESTTDEGGEKNA